MATIKGVKGTFRLGDFRAAMEKITDTGFDDSNAVHIEILEPHVDEHQRIFNAELHIDIRDSNNEIVLYGYNSPEGL